MPNKGHKSILHIPLTSLFELDLGERKGHYSDPPECQLSSSQEEH